MELLDSKPVPAWQRLWAQSELHGDVVHQGWTRTVWVANTQLKDFVETMLPYQIWYSVHIILYCKALFFFSSSYVSFHCSHCLFCVSDCQWSQPLHLLVSPLAVLPPSVLRPGDRETGSTSMTSQRPSFLPCTTVRHSYCPWRSPSPSWRSRRRYVRYRSQVIHIVIPP